MLSLAQIYASALSLHMHLFNVPSVSGMDAGGYRDKSRHCSDCSFTLSIRLHDLTPQISWLIGPQLGVAHLQEVYNNVRDKAYPNLVEHGSRTHLPSGPHGCMGLITNVLPE